ncbi:MAG: hypothetical protein NT045_05740 [Candidatus Aureabacteria bacterium]|nr:hypothetical protein [Candidatus Auribacterota bacterium]
MKYSELRSLQPASVFVLFFSAAFVLVLLYYLATELNVISRLPLSPVRQILDKIELLRPIPRALARSCAAGVFVGVGMLLAALLYNVFAGIFGGVRAEIRDDE